MPLNLTTLFRPLKHALVAVHGHGHLAFTRGVLEWNFGAEGLFQRSKRLSPPQGGKIITADLDNRLQGLQNPSGSREERLFRATPGIVPDHQHIREALGRDPQGLKYISG